MNWGDLLVLGLILGFALIGLVNGFIMSIFKIASFFISLFISIKYYPVVADFLMKTSLFNVIKESIQKNLLQQQTGTAQSSHVKQAAADSVINNLHLPGFLKDNLINQIPNPAKLIDVTKITDMISSELTRVAIDIISLIVIYIAVRILLIFAKVILQGIAKLPVFKQVDKLGGFAFGAIEGLLMVYILCAVVMLFHTSPQFKSIFEAIDSSIFAKYFYQHNFIIDWVFPKGKPI